MTQRATYEVKERRLDSATGQLVADLLKKNVANAVLVPTRQPFGGSVMQTLLVNPEEAATAAPFAPVAPSSSATILAKLTRKQPVGAPKIAAFLRPCEVRAFLELVKLKQGSRDNVLLVGVDCYGRYENTDFTKHVGVGEEATLAFYEAMGKLDGSTAYPDIELNSACKSCETPVADNVDLRLVAIGADPSRAVVLEAVTPEGEAALDGLGAEEGEDLSEREQAIAKLIELRRAHREKARAELQEQVSSIEGLMQVIGSCVNCYNCRSACPVCYCRECVFSTEAFSHEGRQYLGWASKRGRLRMPADTLFFHLTRMAHMSPLCVGCGQCSSACPNDIPLAELFGAMGENAQAVFDYLPGRALDEPQPLASFREQELGHITGQVK